LKHSETAEQACVRECKEEVGLDVEISRHLITLDRMSFYLCSYSTKDQPIVLQQKECSDYQWTEPHNLLSIGEIMELRKIGSVFSTIGHEIEAGFEES